MSLNIDTITFGKYRDLTLDRLLRDRKYCNWLLQQKWFEDQYSYLYNRVKDYNPRDYFIDKSLKKIDKNMDISEFIKNYTYFNLVPVKKLKISLNQYEKTCYRYYLKTIQELKDKIENEVKYDIKAPTSWLTKFEKKYGLTREIFKEFLQAYDLPNITGIVEDIKKMGGIDYKGAKAYIIAKENSLSQEAFWQNILKKYRGDKISTQYKYRNCFFDFIDISENVIYECKLNFKDFDEDQYNKYLLTLENFKIVYLISNHTIIDINRKTVFTTRQKDYFKHILKSKSDSKFDSLIKNFKTETVEDIENYFNK